jgi:DNA-binding GntR family transcriptional regulator
MSTVEVVHRHVLTALLRGDVKPGEWMRQDDLAAELGVCMVQVRVDLLRLAAEGLVTFESNRGVVVRVLTADGAEEIYALRRAIEPVLLARSVERLTIVDLAEAEMALADADASVGEANWRFHEALYRGSGWERGITLVGRLHASVAPYVELYTTGLRASARSSAQHRKLLAHCRAGRTVEAVDLLELHLAEAADALVAHLRTAR